jgi:hypothetical protein
MRVDAGSWGLLRAFFGDTPSTLEDSASVGILDAIWLFPRDWQRHNEFKASGIL